MQPLSVILKIIGINPYVSVPQKILNTIFKDAGKDKGSIPVKGMVNDKAYKQTLVKYAGEWRLYINTTILPNSPKRIGEKIKLTIAFDNEERTIVMHPELEKALKANAAAKKVFEALPPSRSKEIVRYIAGLKTEESIKRNVERAINFLLGKERFCWKRQALNLVYRGNKTF